MRLVDLPHDSGPRRIPRGGALAVVIAVLALAIGGLTWLTLGGRAAPRSRRPAAR